MSERQAHTLTPSMHSSRPLMYRPQSRTTTLWSGTRFRIWYPLSPTPSTSSALSNIPCPHHPKSPSNWNENLEKKLESKKDDEVEKKNRHMRRTNKRHSLCADCKKTFGCKRPSPKAPNAHPHLPIFPPIHSTPSPFSAGRSIDREIACEGKSWTAGADAKKNPKSRSGTSRQRSVVCILCPRTKGGRIAFVGPDARLKEELQNLKDEATAKDKGEDDCERRVSQHVGFQSHGR